MEYGPVEDVFEHKFNPYTRGLIDSTPSLIKDNSMVKPIGGTPVNIAELPNGCPFGDRCSDCMPICRERMPSETTVGEDHVVMCHKYTLNNH